MNSQLYTAASGLLFESRRLDLTSNNLANVRTDGYRAQRAFAAEYRAATRTGDPRIDAVNAGVALAGSYTVPGGGPLESTGRPLDVALLDDALLAVRTPGGVRYTRSGSLQVSGDGALTDASGNPVLDRKGEPIRGLDDSAALRGDGDVVARGASRGRLAIYRDPQGVLARAGDNLWDAGGAEARLEEVDDPRLRPGWLEASGTDPVRELVNLIETQRAFETYQRLISLTMNDVNRRAVTEIAGS